MPMLPGCSGVSSHALREACGTRLAEAGATTPARVGLGHASLSEVNRYTKAAERNRLAGQGMPKLIDADGDKRQNENGSKHIRC
jgi:integrase